MASYLHRTAQPPTLATFRSWGSSAGAGRIRLAGAKIGEFIFLTIENQTNSCWIKSDPKIKTLFHDNCGASVEIYSMTVNIL
jgi:hypothetical protein